MKKNQTVRFAPKVSNFCATPKRILSEENAAEADQTDASETYRWADWINNGCNNSSIALVDDPLSGSASDSRPGPNWAGHDRYAYYYNDLAALPACAHTASSIFDPLSSSASDSNPSADWAGYGRCYASVISYAEISEPPTLGPLSSSASGFSPGLNRAGHSCYDYRYDFLSTLPSCSVHKPAASAHDPLNNFDDTNFSQDPSCSVAYPARGDAYNNVSTQMAGSADLMSAFSDLLASAPLASNTSTALCHQQQSQHKSHKKNFLVTSGELNPYPYDFEWNPQEEIFDKWLPKKLSNHRDIEQCEAFSTSKHQMPEHRSAIRKLNEIVAQCSGETPSGDDTARHAALASRSEIDTRTVSGTVLQKKMGTTPSFRSRPSCRSSIAAKLLELGKLYEIYVPLNAQLKACAENFGIVIDDRSASFPGKVYTLDREGTENTSQIIAKAKCSIRKQKAAAQYVHDTTVVLKRHKDFLLEVSRLLIELSQEADQSDQHEWRQVAFALIYKASESGDTHKLAEAATQAREIANEIYCEPFSQNSEVTSPFQSQCCENFSEQHFQEEPVCPLLSTEDSVSLEPENPSEAMEPDQAELSPEELSSELEPSTTSQDSEVAPPLQSQCCENFSEQHFQEEPVCPLLSTEDSVSLEPENPSEAIEPDQAELSPEELSPELELSTTKSVKNSSAAKARPKGTLGWRHKSYLITVGEPVKSPFVVKWDRQEGVFGKKLQLPEDLLQMDTKLRCEKLITYRSEVRGLEEEINALKGEERRVPKQRMLRIIDDITHFSNLLRLHRLYLVLKPLIESLIGTASKLGITLATQPSDPRIYSVDYSDTNRSKRKSCETSKSLRSRRRGLAAREYVEQTLSEFEVHLESLLGVLGTISDLFEISAGKLCLNKHSLRLQILGLLRHLESGDKDKFAEAKKQVLESINGLPAFTDQHLAAPFQGEYQYWKTFHEQYLMESRWFGLSREEYINLELAQYEKDYPEKVKGTPAVVLGEHLVNSGLFRPAPAKTRQTEIEAATRSRLENLGL